jgi:hypothetical protein
MDSRFCFFRRCLLVVAGGGSVACRPQGMVEALSSRPCVRHFMERCVAEMTRPRTATMRLEGSKPSSKAMGLSADVAVWRRSEGSSKRRKKGARAAGFLKLERGRPLGRETCIGAYSLKMIGCICMDTAYWRGTFCMQLGVLGIETAYYCPLRQKQDDLIGTSALATAFAS